MGVYSSYVAEKAISSMMVSFTFLIPLAMTLFCYSRIVYALRQKVTSF